MKNYADRGGCRLSDSGEDAKVKGVRKLSQFRGPDCLGAWNRLDNTLRDLQHTPGLLS